MNLEELDSQPHHHFPRCTQRSYHRLLELHLVSRLLLGILKQERYTDEHLIELGIGFAGRQRIPSGAGSCQLSESDISGETRGHEGKRNR